MIAYLKGLIVSLSEDKCVLDVNSVGYLVFISAKSYANLKQCPPEKQVSLIIETIVKEDAIELYGFFSAIEKDWFLELIKVQGIGHKLAQKILSYFSVEELAKALISGDELAFKKISGIGPKVASRIVIELKNSPKKLGISNIDFSLSEEKTSAKINESLIAKDAISALENLGYKKYDCLKIIDFILSENSEITLENLITLSLRELAKKKF